MGQHVITQSTDTDRQQATSADEPGPGTRGGQRTERERLDREPPGRAPTGWIIASIVAIVAAVAVFAVATTTDQGAIQATSASAETAAIQAEKQEMSDRQALNTGVAELARDDSATVQAEKALLLSAADPATPVRDDSATVQAEKEAMRSRSLGRDDVGDDAETIAQEKAAITADRSSTGTTTEVEGSDQRLHNQVAALAPPVDTNGSDQRLHNQVAELTPDTTGSDQRLHNQVAALAPPVDTNGSDQRLHNQVAEAAALAE